MLLFELHHHLNTSHVNVNPWGKTAETISQYNLNTSHVNVNPQTITHKASMRLYLNTSHVNVNPLEKSHSINLLSLPLLINSSFTNFLPSK